MATTTTAHSVAVFTTDYWEPIICSLYLVGLCSLTWMLQKRFPKWGEWRHTSVARIAIVLILIDSFAYTYTAALLTLGVGTSRNHVSCSVGIWVCIGLYATTKLLITFFLIERIHTVHGKDTPRRKSKLYISNIAMALGWVIVLIVFVTSNNHGRLRDSDGSCVYTLDHRATFSAAGLDIFLDLYFSLLFAVPLLRGIWVKHPKIRWIAIRSLIAAMLSMACSVANLLTIAFLHGRELSWLCLAACTLDTLANCTVLFVITKSDNKLKEPRPNVSELPTFFRPGETQYEEPEGEYQESVHDGRAAGREPRYSLYAGQTPPDPEKLDYSPQSEYPTAMLSTEPSHRPSSSGEGRDLEAGHPEREDMARTV